MKLSQVLALASTGLILNRQTNAGELTPEQKIEKMRAEEATSKQIAEEKARIIAEISREIIESKRIEQDPLCEINSISTIKNAPSYYPLEEKHPLKCVVGLNNAFYFEVESLSGSECFDELKDEIGNSPYIPDKENCEWGYVRDPIQFDKWYIVSTCDQVDEIKGLKSFPSLKTSPDEGYRVSDWNNYKPGTIFPSDYCLL